ncbi:alpha/beta fold hydrolase [Antarctobacter jejuensis]|uniref:alpha/beta fold hydrolase n=1 Tax=Antarctobacter jejuensis TaxID=1439938 RepID=UPI003FD3E8B9
MTLPRNDIPGFTPTRATLDGVEIAYERGGSGPPLLLLHGFPQTRAMWAEVAPILARDFTVICPDLRGYGESGKPKGLASYAFREMARDQLALMRSLGFERFHLAGHDRGGRTAHRLALDTPEAIQTLTVMDIIPTHLLLSDLTYKVARAYYHWFFLAQPEPFPESMIAADPDAYYESCLLGFGAAQLSDFKPDQLAAYRAAWADPDCRRAMCDDYRAAIEIDIHHDAQDLPRRVTCPALVLYGADGAMARAYDVPATWADRLSRIQATAIPGGHFFIDQSPTQTAKALHGFLTGAP